MLAIARVLDAGGLADTGFLDRCTVGFPRLARHLRGGADGILKDPAWAEAITGGPAARIGDLPHEMAAARTLAQALGAPGPGGTRRAAVPRWRQDAAEAHRGEAPPRDGRHRPVPPARIRGAV